MLNVDVTNGIVRQFSSTRSRVDHSVDHLNHQDAVCNLLYHIKYQFNGDFIKADAERVVRQLRSSLQVTAE